MEDNFPQLTEEIVGPLLTGMGFTVSGIDNGIDESGRRASAVYYQGADCKVQIYSSSREGEINTMIGPLQAPNEYGFDNRSRMWHYLNEFTDEPKLSLEQLVAKHRAERENFTTTPRWLEWIKNERIARYYDSAHAAIVAKYGNS